MILVTLLLCWDFKYAGSLFSEIQEANGVVWLTILKSILPILRKQNSHP